MADSTRLDEMKRKVRKLKHLEVKIRFNGNSKVAKNLVWERFFDLHGDSDGTARYSINQLVSMSKEEFKSVVDEYLILLYYELQNKSGNSFSQYQYNPDILAKLNLPLSADENDVKKRFRELVMKYHPDAGGDANKFIELMENYKKLIDTQK
jgi:DnaJ-domain-containing protein 1